VSQFKLKLLLTASTSYFIMDSVETNFMRDCKENVK
jgi:hypothetical protein